MSRPLHPLLVRLLKLIAFITASTAAFIYISSTCPNARPGESMPSLDSSYGIGMDLSPDRGRVAVAYPNGIVQDLAEIAADDTYIETFRRLSRPESKHIAPPYGWTGDYLDDIPRQWHRSLRKRLGIPASADVGVLAGMVSQLRDAAEERLGARADQATVTVPLINAIYHEDIKDVFEYLRMTEVTNPFETRILDPSGTISHTSSLMAAHDLRTCPHFADRARCTAELYNDRDEFAFNRSFTVGMFESALVVTQGTPANAYTIVMEYPGDARLIMDFGYDMRENYGPRWNYWDLVRRVLPVGPSQYLTSYGEPYVILYGHPDAVADPDLEKTVRKYLTEAGVNETVKIWKDMPETAISRGAAKLSAQFLTVHKNMTEDRGPEGL